MRKILLSLILLFLLFPLSAEAYKSNALGQKMEKIDERSNIGWEREDREDETIIYKDGVTIRETKYFSDGWNIFEENSSERVFIDEKSRVVRRIITKPDSVEEYNYYYDDKAMLSYIYSYNEEIVRKVDYILAGNKAVGFDGTNSALFDNNAIVYNIDGKSVKADLAHLEPESLFIPEFDQDKLVQEKDGRVYAFDKNGRLVEERDGNSYIFYSYSGSGELVRKRYLEGGNSRVEEYENSVLVKTTYFENNVITKTKRTLPSGDIEEIRYISGVAKYRMIFDVDGKRLKEVTKL